MGNYYEHNPFFSIWYLVQIKPNSHAIAERNLKQQGFMTFQPSIEETVKRSGKFITQSRPLFSGYMFVCVGQNSTPWRAINSTYGVSKLVTLGGSKPKVVPEKLIVNLMSRCNDKGRLLPPTALHIGDEVRVTSGPFVDFVSKIEKISLDERVWVLLDILGGEVKVAVSCKNVQKI